MSKLNKKQARARRHRRLRRRVSGTAQIPRLSVCRTGKHIYAQVIDDEKAQTVCSASSLDPAFREGDMHPDMGGAAVLGKTLAERALAADVKRVVFDRGGFRFHGKVKALADAAREAGLEF